MKTRYIFGLAVVGALLAIGSAVIASLPTKAMPPAFTPATNPYAQGIYADGVVESYLGSGENINIYPEVSGRVARILVHEGDKVKAGTPLLQIDDTVQRATAAQQQQQAQAALAMLQELQSMPRKETLDVAKAQQVLAEANRRTAADEYAKQKRSFDTDPRSISRDALDNAYDALKAAEANLQVATRQYELTRAGAWVYDVNNQQMQYNALVEAARASSALLDKYTISATVDGPVLAINTSVGAYVSAQGVYDTYTQSYDPVVVMGTPQDFLAVRCYVDEILVDRLPDPAHMQAQMSVRGTRLTVPLEFVRTQPYVTPKIELSDQRQERVDLRVLPVIFRFRVPAGAHLYPGELVDVYVGAK
jgi:HlyD family secretion protein